MVMKRIDINADNGTIILPNQYAFSPSLTQEEFCNGGMFGNAQSKTYGTFPWIHYRFSGGKLSGRNLLVNLCFFDQVIVSATMSVNLYPPGAADWSHYSLDVEAAAKQFYDAMLQEILGAPADSQLLANMNLDAAHECLARPLLWVFPWGTVRSAHDFKGGGTYIMVSYGNRKEEASKLYLS